MADYKEVVEMLGESLASLLKLVNKLLIDWAIEPKKLLHTLHNIRKEDFLGIVNGTHEIVKKNCGSIIQKDYKIINSKIQIVPQERDRKMILGDLSSYFLGDNFKKRFYDKLTSCETNAESLDEAELLKYKKDKEIKIQLCIQKISCEQIAERIIQFTRFKKITQWTVIGYNQEFVVFVYPSKDGRVGVGTYGIDGWQAGFHLLFG